MSIAEDRHLGHVELATLEQGLGEIRRSPADQGRVELIVRRPAPSQRETLVEAVLDAELGLLGDRWSTDTGGGRRRGPEPNAQVTVTNARSIALIANDPERRQLAGDQLYVDLDLSYDNLPPGTRLRVGSAVIEVTAQPHRGCGKFVARFGIDAQRFVNSPTGRELNLRGINARIITGGVVQTGDVIEKVP